MLRTFSLYKRECPKCPVTRGLRIRGAKHAPPGDRWPSEGSEGVPPVGGPETPLTHDISGESLSNERFSTSINMIFSVDYDGINPIAVRQREHQEHFRFWSKS